MNSRKGKIFYGWYIVVAGILLNSIGMGIIGTKGIFFADIIETLSVNQTQVSMIVMFITIGTLIGGAIAGKVIAKLGARKAVLIFGMTSSVLMGCLGLVPSLNAMYLVAILAGIAIFITSVVTVPALLTNWFVEKRGLAVGLAMAGTGLSPTFIAPYLAPVIGNYGYQTGYIHLSVIMIAATLLSVLIIRNKPEDIGLVAYGANSEKSVESQSDAEKDSKAQVIDIDFKTAIKSPSFFLFVGFGICTVFLAAGLVIQVPSYLAVEGLSATAIGMVLAVFGICMVLGKVLAGMVFDKLGLYKGNLIFFAIAVIALLSLFLVPSRFGLAIYMLLGGAGFAFNSVANPIMVSTLFGSKSYSQILSVYMIFFSLGAVFSSLGSGLIIDLFGFNSLIFAGLIAVAAGAACSCLSLAVGKKAQDKLAASH